MLVYQRVSQKGLQWDRARASLLQMLGGRPSWSTEKVVIQVSETLDFRPDYLLRLWLGNKSKFIVFVGKEFGNQALICKDVRFSKLRSLRNHRREGRSFGPGEIMAR